MLILTSLYNRLTSRKGANTEKPNEPASIFRFFDLPPEIRDKIYTLLVTEPLCPSKPDWPVTPKCFFDSVLKRGIYKTPMIAPVVHDCILQSPNWLFYNEARATFFRLRILSVLLREQSLPALDFEDQLHASTDTSGPAPNLVVLKKGLVVPQCWDATLLATIKASCLDLMRFCEARFEVLVWSELDRATSMLWMLKRAMCLPSAYPRCERSWSMYVNVNIAKFVVQADVHAGNGATRIDSTNRVIQQFHELMGQLLALAKIESMDVWVHCELDTHQPSNFYPPSSEKKPGYMSAMDKMIAFFKEQGVLPILGNDKEKVPSWMKHRCDDKTYSRKAETTSLFHFPPRKPA